MFSFQQKLWSIQRNKNVWLIHRKWTETVPQEAHILDLKDKEFNPIYNQRAKGNYGQTDRGNW